MAKTTGIEWTQGGHTWNPWYGCTQVSPGCAHCYMFREQRIYGNNPELVTRSKTKFKEPLGWKTPALVFTCSWSDWFHEAADEWRPAAWEIVRQSPHLTFQILTKRPERIAAQLPADWGAGWPNVWLGVSVENQRFVHRIETLSRIPAAKRFVSAEPLLGALDLLRLRPGPDTLLETIDWLIVGGESGPDPRPMNLEWARYLRDQCAEVGVPFFFKQIGGWPDKRDKDKALLDGVRHVEMPA